MTELINPTVLAPSEPGPLIPDEGAEGLSRKSLSPRQMALRRYRSHKPAMVATVVLLVMVIFVLLAPLTARYGVDEAVFESGGGRSNRYLSPQSIAWFGTDEISRDLYSRLIYGGRVSLAIGMAAAIIGVLVGTVVGAWAGIRGGFFDDVLMRVTDMFLAFPFLVSLLVMRNMLGEVGWLTPIIGERTSMRFVILLLALFGWMGVARVVRGQVLSLKEREFIEASRALGASNKRIIVRHLLPNSLGPILVAMTLSVVAAVIAESTLVLRVRAAARVGLDVARPADRRVEGDRAHGQLVDGALPVRDAAARRPHHQLRRRRLARRHRPQDAAWLR